MRIAKLVAASLVVTLKLFAVQIIPAGITGTGPFENNASIMIDGVIPEQGNVHNGPWSVHWTGTVTNFVIDLGNVFTVADLLASVDNNDNYVFERSLDNVSYVPFLTILDIYGNRFFGLDTMNTFAGDPEYVAGIDFAPVQMRYIRISANGGDNLYGIGEVQVFSADAAIPEPATTSLVGAGIALAVLRLRRRLSS